MHYSLTSDELDLRSAFRTYLASRVPQNEPGSEQEIGLDVELWRDLVTTGWLDLWAMGAQEGSAWPATGVHMAEELGRALVAAPVELIGGFLLPLLHELPPGTLGVHLDEDPFADAVPTASVAPLLAMVFGARTSPPPVVEELDSGSITVSGRWGAVEFAASADWFFLPVRLTRGWTLVRVPLAVGGVTVEPSRSMMPGRPCGTITLSAVEISADDIVSTGERGQSMEHLLHEALLSYLLVLDGKAVGAAELLLERTIAYVKDRTQFGVPVGSFQAVKHRLADMATAVESARSLAAYTAWQVAQGAEDRFVGVLASRLHCADAYQRVVENAIQCHGGMGFTWEVGLHRWYRSAAHDAASTGLTMSDLARLLGDAA